MAVVLAIKGIPKTIIVEIALARSRGVIFLDFCLLSGSLILILVVSIICPFTLYHICNKMMCFFGPRRFLMVATCEQNLYSPMVIGSTQVTG